MKYLGVEIVVRINTYDLFEVVVAGITERGLDL